MTKININGHGHQAHLKAALDVPEPRPRPRMTDGCGPEHTYQGTCEYADWAKDSAR